MENGAYKERLRTHSVVRVVTKFSQSFGIVTQANVLKVTGEIVASTVFQKVNSPGPPSSFMQSVTSSTYYKLNSTTVH